MARATTGCCLKAEKRGNGIVRAPSYALSQFYREHLAFLLPSLRRFDTTSKFRNLFTRRGGKGGHFSAVSFYVLHPRVISTAYRVPTILQDFFLQRLRQSSKRSSRISRGSQRLTIPEFLPGAGIVITISLRSEFCTAHREGERGCPRASLSMAFPYEGGGWIRTPKGEMAHSDALIQRGP